ncbi:hypothetical protein LV779_08735 [Streptomyces thinghirensis]|nr:hypothetical protein [Streptomyces thinghirensis]
MVLGAVRNHRRRPGVSCRQRTATPSGGGPRYAHDDCPDCPDCRRPGALRSRDAQGDFLLQPPDPAARVPSRIDPVDLRRLDLLALLTAVRASRPPAGDRAAIAQLSELPGSVHTALHRWLEQAYGFCR